MRSFPEAYNEIHIFEYQHFFPKKPAFDGGTNLRLSGGLSSFLFWRRPPTLALSPKNERLIAGYGGTPLPKLLFSAPPPGR